MADRISSDGLGGLRLWAGLQVGAGRRDITPREPVPM
jgi:hypothetical protein